MKNDIIQATVESVSVASMLSVLIFVGFSIVNFASI